MKYLVRNDTGTHKFLSNGRIESLTTSQFFLVHNASAHTS